MSRQENLISGVHCYNKATGFSGIGIIYLQLPGLPQIIDSYMDYTGIVSHDLLQLTVANILSPRRHVYAPQVDQGRGERRNSL